MVLAALVCVTLAYVRLRHDYTAVALERGRLRNQLGLLDIHNPEMGYERQAYSSKRLTWKIRVHLPEGRYWLCYKSGALPKPYFKAERPQLSIPITGGEFPLTFSMRKEDGQWWMRIETNDVERNVRIDQATGDWIAQTAKDDSVPFSSNQIEFPPGEPMILLNQFDADNNGELRGAVCYVDPIDPQTRLSESRTAKDGE